MCRSPKTAVGGEGDGAEIDVESLVIDDLVGGLVLGLGVDVGGGTTCSLTRRLGVHDSNRVEQGRPHAGYQGDKVALVW